MILRTLLATMAGLLIASQALAVPITLDFSDFDGDSEFTLIPDGFYDATGLIFDQSLSVQNELSFISDSGGAGIGTVETGANLSGSFTSSVSFFSVWVGDRPLVGTDFDLVLLEGFDIDGNLVDSATYFDLGAQQLSLSGSGIVRFQFTNGSLLPSGLGAPGSVDYDDFVFVLDTDGGSSNGNGSTNPIPEPNAAVLFGLGVLVVGRGLRRKALND